MAFGYRFWCGHRNYVLDEYTISINYTLSIIGRGTMVMLEEYATVYLNFETAVMEPSDCVEAL